MNNGTLIINGTVYGCDTCNTTAGMLGCEKHRHLMETTLNDSVIETTLDDKLLEIWNKDTVMAYQELLSLVRKQLSFHEQKGYERGRKEYRERIMNCLLKNKEVDVKETVMNWIKDKHGLNGWEMDLVHLVEEIDSMEFHHGYNLGYSDAEHEFNVFKKEV